MKTASRDGRYALQVGAGSRKPKQAAGSERGHFERWGTGLKRRLAEFAVSRDAMLPSGTAISARHFVPGQYVDVSGVTKGKGFCGVMKRWDFRGGRASHGASLSHRSPGSTGQRQDPGKVFKGKKMPGHWGAERQTVQNVYLHKIDPARNVLFVRGQVSGRPGGGKGGGGGCTWTGHVGRGGRCCCRRPVTDLSARPPPPPQIPGPIGAFVEVRDALRRRPDEVPFPTFVPPQGEDSAALRPIVAPAGPDPFADPKAKGAADDDKK